MLALWWESEGVGSCIVALFITMVTGEGKFFEDNRLLDGNSLREPYLDAMRDLLSKVL